MYKTIQHFYDSNLKTGLMFLDMPTGFGKSYEAMRFITDCFIENPELDKKFFFVTTLKKNLPINKLRNMFAKRGNAQLFDDKFIFVNSNLDLVKENLTNELHQIIPNSIRNTDEYKKLRSDVSFLNQSKKSKIYYDTSSVEDILRTKSEPNFRKMVSLILCKKYQTTNERILAIKNDPEWQWLGKLYPTVFTKEKKIFFMSMDKFILRNATIVEPPYFFYNSGLINDSIIFIDEIDSTKKNVLDSIIKNGLYDNINYIDLFKSIHNVLKTNEFPKALLTPSKQQLNSKYGADSLKKTINNFQKISDEIYDLFNLQYSHKTNVNAIDESRNFLFQDYKYYSILNGNNKYINTNTDKNNKINVLSFSKNKSNDVENDNVQTLLSKVRGFLSYFNTGVKILATNYKQFKEENRKDGEDDFSFEASIRTVLSLFNLPQEYIDFLTNKILLDSKGNSKDKIMDYECDLSFYNKGFRYFAFEDDINHDMQSNIMMYTFSTTPEKILLKFCEKAKVIGISATSTIDTVVGNYSIEYLKYKLGNNYYNIPKEDKIRMSEEFRKSCIGYDKVNINSELIGLNKVSNEYSPEMWETIFESKELAFATFGLLDQDICNISRDKEFLMNRYFNICMAFKKFVVHDDIDSFLCVLNTFPAKNNPELDYDRLKQIFEFIATDNNKKGYESYFTVLTGKEYDDNKEKLLKDLHNGYKKFVVSTYQTLGAGQNLQYAIPKNLKGKLIQTNNTYKDTEKDFDAIYLDKPTNMFVSKLNPNSEEEDFIRSIYETEYLKENGELSREDASSYIKESFKSFNKLGYQHNYSKAKKSTTQSIKRFATRILIQAVGRICRTNNKKQNIYIYADKDIADYIDYDSINDRLLNKEFESLIECANIYCKSIEQPSNIEFKANEISNRVYVDICNTKINWTDNKIHKWQQLRDISLRNPTIDIETANKDVVFMNYYVQLPKKDNILFYWQEEDYKNVHCTFDRNSAYVVSEKSCFLDKLMSIKCLNDHFKEKGYATRFEKNEFIMSPTLFNNIYKGALGEVVGKYMVEKLINKEEFEYKELVELTDNETYEFFDYKLKDSNIYFDFKLWHENMHVDDLKEKQHIYEKAVKCGTKCVFIINIASEKNYQIKHSKFKDVDIYTVPSLIKLGNKIEIDSHNCKELKGVLLKKIYENKQD